VYRVGEKATEVSKHREDFIGATGECGTIDRESCRAIGELVVVSCSAYRPGEPDKLALRNEDRRENLVELAAVRGALAGEAPLFTCGQTVERKSS